MTAPITTAEASHEPAPPLPIVEAMCACNGANNDYDRPQAEPASPTTPESVARLAELDAAAIDAVVGGKAERDITALKSGRPKRASGSRCCKRR